MRPQWQLTNDSLALPRLTLPLKERNGAQSLPWAVFQKRCTSICPSTNPHFPCNDSSTWRGSICQDVSPTYWRRRRLSLLLPRWACVQQVQNSVELTFLLEAVWAAGCANITIKSQDDADEVRKNCKDIQGYLTFDDYLDESINLDGIEFINGDIRYTGDSEWGNATEIGGPYPTTLKPITIECSTLKTVNGSIYFWAFEGLSEFLLPKLTRVEESFTLQRMHYLRKLDITKLTHLGSFNIEANHLTELKHEGLKGFTDGAFSRSIRFWGIRVSSVDSWFKYPLTAIARDSEYDDLTSWAPVHIDANRIPKIKSVTIGYANTSKIWVEGNDTELTLGSSETETMNIGFLQLQGDLTKITRAPNVKEINVGQLYFRGSSLKEIDLTIFDKITNLTIYDHGNLQRIRMPAKAVDWEDMTISIEMNQNLTLISEYRDPENKTDQFWYWPKGNISRISIMGNPLSTGFL